MSVPTSLARLAVVAVAGSLLALGGAGVAAADTTSAAYDLGGGALATAGHAVFLVKDLGGGAYWNVTTGSLFVVDNAANTFGSTLTAGEELLATAVDDGRGALLLANGTVLVPAQQAIGL